MGTLGKLKAARLANVYEFRPLPGELQGPVRRYADGAWIEDDGEYDLCFVSGGYGAPIALMFEPSYQSNIIYSWLTTHWTGRVQQHPDGNPWHYAIAEGETRWGGDWNRDRHPNYLAGRKGMDFQCKEHGCANGRHVEFKSDDPHVAAGVVRNRETREVFRWPEGMRCMYCGIAPAFGEAIAREVA